MSIPGISAIEQERKENMKKEVVSGGDDNYDIGYETGVKCGMEKLLFELEKVDLNMDRITIIEQIIDLKSKYAEKTRS